MSKLIATVFYVGFLKPASGTWGSAAAVPFAWLIWLIGGWPLLAIGIVSGFLKGWWATAKYIEAGEDHDPSEVVVDELVGQWIALLPVAIGASHAGASFWALWPGILTAFLAFRLFDIWKPGPIGWADRRGDALGVMLDDVIAGCLPPLSCLLVHISRMDDAAHLLDLARSRNILVATAESCTGGGIAAALTEIPGSSDVVDRGFVTYSNAAKIEMLGIAQTTLDAYGAVSEQIAREMAEGALQYSDAGITISVTGIAGPGGSEHKPEGRVCFGLARTGHKTRTETVEFGPLGRHEVRAATVTYAIRLMQNALNP